MCCIEGRHDPVEDSKTMPESQSEDSDWPGSQDVDRKDPEDWG